MKKSSVVMLLLSVGLRRLAQGRAHGAGSGEFD